MPSIRTYITLFLNNGMIYFLSDTGWKLAWELLSVLPLLPFSTQKVKGIKSKESIIPYVKVQMQRFVLLSRIWKASEGMYMKGIVVYWI